MSLTESNAVAVCLALLLKAEKDFIQKIPKYSNSLQCCRFVAVALDQRMLMHRLLLQ